MATTAQPAYTFVEETHTYLENGIAVPSVTQVLGSVGLYDLSRIPFDVLEHKRQLGSAVHKAAEFIDSPSGDELDWDTVDEECVPYVVGYEQFCKDYGFKATLVEHRGVFTTPHGMKFGYQLDRLGTIEGGSELLLDIKCALDESISWPVQLAAYELTLPKPKAQPCYRRVALHLGDDARYKLHSYADPQDRNVFLWALALTHWKLNHGMKLETR